MIRRSVRPPRRGMPLLAAAGLVLAAAVLPRPAAAADPGFDVERYLNIRSATRPGFSPSGEWVGFLSNITGVNQVWRVPAGGGWPDQVTFGSEPVGAFEWSPTDENRILFARDVGGNERDQLYLADLASGALRRLTGGDEVIHNFGGWSRDGRRIVYSANARDQAFFDLYVMDVDAGREERVLTRDAAIYPGPFSPDGRQVLGVEFRSGFDQDIWLVDLAGGAAPRLLTPHRGDVQFRPYAWTADGRGLWVLSDRDRDFVNLARLDLASGRLDFRDDTKWDVEALAVSDDGSQLAVVRNVDGYGRLELSDVAADGAARARPAPDLPPGFVLEPTWSRDGARLAFRLSGPTHPSDIWVFDPAAGAPRRITESSTAGIPRDTFVPSELVQFPSFDGLRIPGFLYRPAGHGDRPMPIIVNVHGGPESQSQATFSGLTQYFVGRGFGVFYPNVRGSTGYGKRFSHLDDVARRLDSVRDLAEAAKWLVASGIAAPGRVAVSGGSYGGYMTLAALAFHPDLWACGSSNVGISNLRTFIANTGAWRRSLRMAEYGDPAKDGAAMDAASPIHRADRIRAPLMIIQGANDPRVPKSEADQIVAAVRANGGTVEYLLYGDEGHGLGKLTNRVEAYSRMADFMEKYLLAPAPPAATP